MKIGTDLRRARFSHENDALRACQRSTRTDNVLGATYIFEYRDNGDELHLIETEGEFTAHHFTRIAAQLVRDGNAERVYGVDADKPVAEMVTREVANV